MPLDRLPRATRGDPHGLVVVPRRAARGERVVEPEAVLRRLGVGDVGERRGALVGRHDQIHVVAVVADDVGRRHRPSLDPVVSEVEEARDEPLVCDDSLRQPGVTVDRRVRQPLGVEPALAPGGDDDGVLDHLRLDQPEDLGAKVLPAIRPPQPASGDLPEPQMHALDPWTVDPDLEHRPRHGEVRDLARVELDAHVRLGAARAGWVRLVVVRPQCRLGHAEEGADDAVLVEAPDVLQRLMDGVGNRRLRLGSLGADLARIPLRVQAGLEQVDELSRDHWVRDERRLDVVLRERRPGLPEVLREHAEDDHLTPGQAGAEHERVEPVRLRGAGPHRADGVLEQQPPRVAVTSDAPVLGTPGAQPEVVDVDTDTVAARHLVGALVDHLHPEVGEHRQHPGECQWSSAVELEPALVRRRALVLVESHLDGVVGVEHLNAPDVGDGYPGMDVLLVCLGKRLAVQTDQPSPGLFADPAAKRLDEVLVPGAGRVDDLALEGRLVDLRDGRPLADPHDEVQPGQRRLGDASRVVDALGVERPPQDLLHLEPDRRVVAVAGQEDQR